MTRWNEEFSRRSRRRWIWPWSQFLRRGQQAFAGRRLRRCRDDLAAAQRHHLAVLFLGNEFHGSRAEAGAQQAIEWRGRAAALHVTKHSYANFLLRAAPEHVSNQVANRTGARGGAPLDLELGPPLGGHDNTLGHAHDGEGLPAALAALDEVADILEFERDFGDEDDVGAAGDAGFERDPAGIAAHNFHHHDAVMRLSGGEELVNGLNTGVQRGIEAEGDIGGGEVVVNGLGNAYDVQPLLEEVEGNRLGAVAAHHDDSVNAERASIADKVH